MPFEREDSKINRRGRPKGSKNKKSEFVRELISNVLSENVYKFEEELKNLKGRNFVDSYLSLLEYYLPKLARKGADSETATKMEMPTIIIK